MTGFDFGIYTCIFFSLCLGLILAQNIHIIPHQEKQKILETIKISRIFCGDPSGIRTPDPLLKRQLLCRLS